MRKNILILIILFSLTIFVVLGVVVFQRNMLNISTPSTDIEPQRKLITPLQLKKMLETKDFVLINVHIPYEGEIEQTDYNIDYRLVEEFERRFAKDQKIVIYCRSGAMSSVLHRKLLKRGFTNIYELEGGMIAWQKAGGKLMFYK